MPHVIIHTPGFLTTIQDQGRYGYQRFGMPVAGAMDGFSMTLCNLLVGNPPDAACMEATLTGPEMMFSSSGAIAVCGADMGPCINGRPISLWSTIKVKKDDQLHFTGLKKGCRTYIAFSGGIDVPMIMNSRSTYLRAKTGGVEGRALKPGDKVPLGPIRHKLPKKEIPSRLIPEYLSFQTVQALTGPEAKRFDPEVIRAFFSSEYVISEQSDRMGYRLTGPKINHPETGADIISAGVSLGTIQVPGNGEPIILMADRQTTGGYARIANVASVDLALVAQMKPGDRIRFKEISLDKAQKLLAAQKQLFAKLF